MQHSPTGPYGSRRRRATIALIESDWLDVKMWSRSRCLGFEATVVARVARDAVEMKCLVVVKCSIAGGGRVEVTTRRRGGSG